MDKLTFLRSFHPAGPWVLSAIHPEPPKQIETRTFMPDEAEACAQWVERHNVERNIYFSVNLPNRRLTKKATKTDIHSVPWLHVDIDARAADPRDMEVEGAAAAHLAREIERIRLLVTDRCPTPAPTVIIFSGGGYQVFWRLEVPFAVDGQLELAEELAGYNRQLLNELDGDISAPNADRIMRLPQTTNWPDEKKRKRGRLVALAEVYSFDPSLVYPLSKFMPAPPLQVRGPLGGGPHHTVGATSNIERLANVDDLDKWKVADRVKLIVVQGEDVDNPKDGDNSRSAWLFDAICNLVRSSVPDDVIFSVITDPDFKISESVLEKAPNHARYAGRQIQRAKEEIEEPVLREFNERFMVIGNIGGKCRVVEEVPEFGSPRSRLTHQTFSDFMNRYCHRSVEAGGKSFAAGRWWLGHPGRRQYDFVVFQPGGDPPNSYNLWQGFSFRSLPGERHRSFLGHIEDNLCQGVEEHYNYLLGWMARAVQKPATPGETAVVLRGAQGTGKSFFAKQFGALWGRHFLQVSNAKHLLGAFNGHLRDVVVLFGDEAFFAGDKQHESVLKTTITEERRMLERKGIDAEPAPNFTHMILASNSEWVVPAGNSERRFFVLDVANAHLQDSPYFKGIVSDLEDGGYENLLHFLLTYDISKFNVRDVPKTKALLDQKDRTMGGLYDWWKLRLEEGALLRDQASYECHVKCRDLLEQCAHHLMSYNSNRRGSETQVGLFLRSMCPPGYPKKSREGGGDRQYYYEFPSLLVLRGLWEERQGQPIEWPDQVPQVEQSDMPF